jgi:sec-independent protein translocase protein TatC
MPSLKVPSILEPSANDANSADAYGVLTAAELRGVLRSHLVRFCVGIGLAFIVGMFLVRPLFGFARDHVSIERCCGPGSETAEWIANNAPFFKTVLNIVIAAGLLLFYYQVVEFVSPRLTASERRYAYGSLPFVVLCFLLGAAFTFFVVLPRILELLEDFRIRSSTFRVYVHVPLVIGSVFELIFIMYMLARLGIVSPRQMSASRRYAVVAALLTAAVFTLWPLRLDMVLLVAGVIYALYEVGIILAKIADRRRNPLGKHSDDRRYCDFFEVVRWPRTVMSSAPASSRSLSDLPWPSSPVFG